MIVKITRLVKQKIYQDYYINICKITYTYIIKLPIARDFVRVCKYD